MTSTDTLGLLKKYYHWVGADSYICPYQCSLCCGSAEHHPVRLRLPLYGYTDTLVHNISAEHHPVRLRLPPLHRRGISDAILFQQPHTTAIASRLYPAAKPDGVVSSVPTKLTKTVEADNSPLVEGNHSCGR